ncbi:MAG: hypothetical protein VW910_04530 [Pelagibacteraceae bacterium]
MACLTASGVRFNDNTTLNSFYGIIPQGSDTLFYQAAAPTGWTKLTGLNDYALRVVSGSGGSTGGSTAFSSIFPTSLRPVSQPGVPMSGSVGNHTLSAPQMAAHSHPNTATRLTPGGGDVGSGAGWTRSTPSTGNAGGGGAHNHPWSGTCNFTGSFDMRITYMNVILCKFD